MFKSNRSKEDFSVKRVLQKDDHYICGMCGKKYSTFTAAQACLDRDVEGYMSSESVREAPQKHGVKRYRCRHCRRLYVRAEEASDCARLCKEKIAKRLAVEKSLRNTGKDLTKKMAALAKMSGSAETVQAIAKRVEAMKGITRKGNYFICQICGKQHLAVMEARACVKSHMVPVEHKLKRNADKATGHNPAQTPPDIPVSEAAIDPSFEQGAPDPSIESFEDEPLTEGLDAAASADHQAESSVEDIDFEDLSLEDESLTAAGASTAESDDASSEMQQAEEQPPRDPNYEKAVRINAKKDKDKFIRSGARYVCRACNEQFFTKMEVVACFDKHLSGGSVEAEESEDSAGDTTDDAAEQVTAASDAMPSESVVSPEEPSWEEAFEESEQGGAPVQESGQEASASVSEASKFSRDGAKYVCTKCNQKYFTKQEVLDCFDSDCLTDPHSIGSWAGEGADDTSESDGGVPAASLAKRDKSQEHKFSRDGAKYICKSCGKRHFTRSEVIACFDSH